MRCKPKNKKLGFNFNPVPSLDEKRKWKIDLDQWINSNISLINKGTKNSDKSNKISYAEKVNLKSNVDLIYDILDVNSASNFGDYNSTVISKVVNENFKMPTLFYNYSSSIELLSNDFLELFKNLELYVCSHNKHLERTKEIIEISKEDYVKKIDATNIPFRYQCECGSAVSLSIQNNNFTGFCGKGYSNCNKEHIFTIDNFFSKEGSKIIPRAISRNLIFFNYSKPDLYVSGWGAMPFTLVGRGISNDLSLYYPPIINYDNTNLDNIFMKFNEHNSDIDLFSLRQLIPSFVEIVITYGFSSVLEKWEENYRKGLINLNY